MADRPLVVTSDPVLLDELLRIHAASGVEPEVAADLGAARVGWDRAPLVLIGADAAHISERSGLPRRSDVLLVVTDLDDGRAWALAGRVGADGVVPLPDGESVLAERIATSPAAEATGPVVAVIGGRGGAGASTIAGALAVTAAAHSPVLLVDADPLGGGLDLSLGAEAAPGLRWPDLVSSHGRLSPDDLRAALPAIDGVSLLAWHRGEPVDGSPEAMSAVLAAGRRGFGLVVVDLPRRLDPAATLALAGADLALLVVPADVRAVAAAAQVVRQPGVVRADVRLVVRGPAPAGLSATSVSHTLGVPLLGWLAPDSRLAAAYERGEPPARSGRGPLARLCRTVLAEAATVTGRAA